MRINLKREPDIHGGLIFNKGVRLTQWRKKGFPNKWCQNNWVSFGRKQVKYYFFFISHQKKKKKEKTKLKVDLNTKPKIYINKAIRWKYRGFF